MKNDEAKTQLTIVSSVIANALKSLINFNINGAEILPIAKNEPHNACINAVVELVVESSIALKYEAI